MQITKKKQFKTLPKKANFWRVDVTNFDIVCLENKKSKEMMRSECLDSNWYLLFTTAKEALKAYKKLLKDEGMWTEDEGV